MSRPSSAFALPNRLATALEASFDPESTSSMVRANFSREKVGGVMMGYGVKRGLTPETIQKVIANDPEVMKAWNNIDRKYAERFRLED